MPWYSGKDVIRDYLKAINADENVLEYTLFQPGLFVNYFTHPFRSAKHVSTFQTQIDFQNCRAILPSGYEHVKITLTEASDLAEVVAKAIDYEGIWPVNGGIQGCQISLGELLKIGEDVRGRLNSVAVLIWVLLNCSLLGKPFHIDILETAQLEKGVVESSWMPIVEHAAIPPEQAKAMASTFVGGMTLGMVAGELSISDEWNRIFPTFCFKQPRDFLARAWAGKP